jgi:hypothetical protein
MPFGNGNREVQVGIVEGGADAELESDASHHMHDRRRLDA